MQSILIAVDDPRRPKKSVMLLGPETPVDEVKREFHRVKMAASNSAGLPWVALWGAESPQLAHTPNKQTKDKK